MELDERRGEVFDDLVDRDVIGLTRLDLLERVAVDLLHEQKRAALQIAAVERRESGADLHDLELETLAE